MDSEDRTVSIHREIAPETLGRLVAMYELGFQPIEGLSAVDQAFTSEEVDRYLRDSRVLKFIGKCGPDPVALAMVTNDLSSVKWINPQYYEVRYPEHARRSAIYYYLCLVVHPRHQHGPWVTAITEAISMRVGAEMAVMAFDCCQYNVETVGVPSFAKAVTERFVDLEFTELDTQKYYAIEVTAMKAISLRDTNDDGVRIDISDQETTTVPTRR